MRLVLALVLLAGLAYADLPGEYPIKGITQETPVPCAGKLMLPSAYYTCTCTGSGPLCIPKNPKLINAISGVDCTGATDSTSGINTALTAAAGKTLFIPAGCVPRLASPSCVSTTCGPSIVVPSNTKILCEDNTAGFAVLRQRCTGGTYPGAACNTDAECLGGGTCDNDFNGTSANPCTSSTCYAPTAANTYAMLQDTAQSGGITIENCTFWTGQAEPYQRCTGTGGNNGDPCRQECSGDSFPGVRCSQDADCSGGGTCLRRADCTGAGGRGSCGGAPCCAGAPHSTSSNSTAKINPVDLARTVGARIVNVRVDDHFVGDWGIKTGSQATIIDTNVAHEDTDCTSPFSTPSNSFCFGSSAGVCCYGANNFATSNVQPTVAVTDGIVVGPYSRIVRSRGRGTTSAFNDPSGNSSIDESVVIPSVSQGPGTQSAGVRIQNSSIISKSIVQNLVSGATGIRIGGVGSTAIENKISGSHSVGISIVAVDAHVEGNTIATVPASGQGIITTSTGTRIVGNTISGVTSSGVGIDLSGNRASAQGNYVVGDASSGVAIRINADDANVVGNTVESSAASNMATGIKVDSGGHDNAIIEGNQILNMHDTSIVLTSGFGARIVGNTSKLSATRPTTALHPQHVLSDSGATQVTIAQNYFEGGWRGFATGARTDGLTNTNLIGNRFMALGGAMIAAGGAGVNSNGNYYNPQLGGGPSLTCDASCTGGAGRGGFCVQDSDCSSCAGSVQKCIPEPLVTYWGPSPIGGRLRPLCWRPRTSRWSETSSSRRQARRQCFSVRTAAGRRRTSGLSVRSASRPARVVVGPAPVDRPQHARVVRRTASFAARGPVRIPARRAATRRSSGWSTRTAARTSISDGVFSINQTFAGSTGSNMRGLDFGLTNLGNLHMERTVFSSNVFTIGTTTSTSAIRFPTAGTFSDNNLTGNNFTGWGIDVENWKGTCGSLAYVPTTMSLHADQTTNSTTFTNVTDGTSILQVAVDSNRSYTFNCEFTFTSSATTTGIAFAMQGPATPTTFTYISRLPALTVESTSGTDNMFEQEGNADDDTPTAIPGVAAAGNKYTAAIRGNLTTGASAGNLTARVKASNANNVTVVKGSNCILWQMP